MDSLNSKENVSNTCEYEENYYLVLGCTESATKEELKRCYQNLIKQYHPDKQGTHQASGDKFILIDKAFKILKDDQLRKEYDASLLANNLETNPVIFAELSKNDLDFQDGHVSFVCRCGNDIIVSENVFKQTLIECSECSNCILIK